LIPKLGVEGGYIEQVFLSNTLGSFAKRTNSNIHFGLLGELELKLNSNISTALLYSSNNAIIYSDGNLLLDIFKISTSYEFNGYHSNSINISPKLGLGYSYMINEEFSNNHSGVIYETSFLNKHDIFYVLGGVFKLGKFILSIDYNTPIRFVFLYRNPDYMISNLSFKIGYSIDL